MKKIAVTLSISFISLASFASWKSPMRLSNKPEDAMVVTVFDPTLENVGYWEVQDPSGQGEDLYMTAAYSAQWASVENPGNQAYQLDCEVTVDWSPHIGSPKSEQWEVWLDYDSPNPDGYGYYDYTGHVVEMIFPLTDRITSVTIDSVIPI